MSQHKPLFRLRPGLKIIRVAPHDFRLIDEQTGAHFELHAGERYLLSLLEELDSWEAVRSAYLSRFGRDLPERETLEFIEQLSQHHLLDDDDKSGDAQVGPEMAPRHWQTLAAIEGDAVNTLFDFLTLFFGWILHPMILTVVVPLFLIEVFILVIHWRRLYDDLVLVWSSFSVLPLFFASYLQTVLLLDLPRALVTGIACRNFRGRVRSLGIYWGNWVIPTISVNTLVGDSLVWMDSRGRLTFIAAGIGVHFALSGIYALLWASGSRASHGYLFWLMMIPPSVLMSIYQCNIFSPYAAGNWALAMATDDWNFRHRALAETKAWLLGDISPEPLGDQQRWWMRTYGLASFAYRFSIDLLLLVGGGWFIVSRFGGTGAAVFGFLVLWWNREHLKPFWQLYTLSFAESAATKQSLTPVGGSS